MSIGIGEYTARFLLRILRIQLNTEISACSPITQYSKNEEYVFLFSGHEPIYFIENKEKTLRASYDRGTQIFDYMD